LQPCFPILMSKIGGGDIRIDVTGPSSSVITHETALLIIMPKNGGGKLHAVVTGYVSPPPPPRSVCNSLN
jgi:hypothetical protein